MSGFKVFVLAFWVVLLLAFAYLYFFQPGLLYRISSDYIGPGTPFIHVPSGN